MTGDKGQNARNQSCLKSLPSLISGPLCAAHSPGWSRAANIVALPMRDNEEQRRQRTEAYPLGVEEVPLQRDLDGCCDAGRQEVRWQIWVHGQGLVCFAGTNEDVVLATFVVPLLVPAVTRASVRHLVEPWAQYGSVPVF